jgi:hypothetical protein
MFQRIKDKIADKKIEAKGRKDAVRNLSQDWGTKITNFIFRTNKTSEEWLESVNASRKERGKPPIKRL